MGNTTTATDISIEKLAEYSGLLENLKEKNTTEITDMLDDINGLLNTNVGSTSAQLIDLNTYISNLHKKHVSLIGQTATSINNISEMFAEEDEEAAAAMKVNN